MTNSSVKPIRNSRRDFLGKVGLIGAGALMASCAPTMAITPPPAVNNDIAILNFALNLEYLEAAFYLTATGRLAELDAVGGNTANVILTGTGVTGNTVVPGLSPAVLAYAQEIATDEKNHVAALRATITSLGGTPVTQPKLDIGPAFVAAGRAIGLPVGVDFNPYANQVLFIHGAFVFEDVGVTAYKGAARLVTNGDVLEAAAGILAVEAYHAGTIRTLLYAIKDDKPLAAAGINLTVAQIVQLISDLRDGADGTTDLDQGIVGGAGNPDYVTGAANLVPTDVNSIAFSRSVAQVLSIVTLGSAGNKGGFFPDGLNGAVGFR